MLNMYEGEVDDVMVWSKPPPKKDILQLWKNESSSPQLRDIKLSWCPLFFGAYCVSNSKSWSLARKILMSIMYYSRCLAEKVITIDYNVLKTTLNLLTHTSREHTCAWVSELHSCCV